MKLSAWRVALRIARRDALRAKGRSALVVAMVALPVLGVAGADIVFRSGELDPGERIVRIMGRADAEITMMERGAAVLQAPDPEDGSMVAGSDDRNAPRSKGQEPATDPAKLTPEQRRSLDTAPDRLAKELLPAGAVLVPVRQGPYVPTSTAEGMTHVQTAEADLADPVWQGRITVLRGRVPAADNEVSATQNFLDQSGLKLGDRTTVRGLDSKPFTITAAVEYPGELRTAGLIARPGALVETLYKQPGADRYGSGRGGEATRWMVKLPGGELAWPKVVELNKYGFTVTSRAVLLDPPARSDVPFYVELDKRGHGGPGSYLDSTAVVILATVAGMALLEIVLLAGPAFAVGARRSRRQLGLLAAGGGDRAQVRAVVLGGGVVLGLTGAALGLVGAIGLVALLQDWAEESSGQRFGHFDLQPLDLIGVLAIGLVTGLLAAVVPAVQASRQDVVAALTGRDSVKPPSRRLAGLGLLMLGAGAAIALVGATSGFVSRGLAVLGGSALAELGMVVLTPFLVGLFGRIGRWLPLGPRLALRDSVRHRGRTAPAVAAVMAAVAGSVAVGVYTASDDEQRRREYVASAPTNAVLISTGWGEGEDPRQVSLMRTAVENNMPGLGVRADVGRIDYPVGCRTKSEGCGSVDLKLPPERECPVWADMDLETPKLSRDEQRRLLREDPRCKTGGTYRSNPYGTLVAGDAPLLKNLFGTEDQAAAKALAEGKAVVFDPRYVKDGRITIELAETMAPGSHPSAPPESAGQPKKHRITVDAVVAALPQPDTSGQTVISPETAKKFGLALTDAGSVWLPETAPAERGEQKAMAAVNKISDSTWFTVERGYRSDAGLASMALTGFAALVALGAAGIATGLAAADSQRDLTTLAAVGAAPGIRRTLSGFQCGVIAAMGAVLGTVCGVVPAVALRKVEGNAVPYDGMPVEEAVDRTVLVFPWLNMGLTLLVLPLLATLLAALLTRSRITLLRRSG
ncbi:FtsX-like permease family protein [Kitasatospora sp. NPDC054939]